MLYDCPIWKVRFCHFVHFLKIFFTMLYDCPILVVRFFLSPKVVKKVLVQCLIIFSFQNTLIRMKATSVCAFFENFFTMLYDCPILQVRFFHFVHFLKTIFTMFYDCPILQIRFFLFQKWSKKCLYNVWLFFRFRTR